MNKKFFTSRRVFLRGSLFGAAAALVTGLLPTSKARGDDDHDDLPLVSEDDPLAVSLNYTHDATHSERTDDSQFCHNCQYFQGTEDEESGGCTIFPGKSVSWNGWCKVWMKKS